ncbi:hypothetical protein H9W95_16700 [Flavobacterium lindanitolerans]|nr:hypothetical protein [Flavobacterium lindanitolerans]
MLNINNLYSWTSAGKPLTFMANYKVDDKGNRITSDSKVSKNAGFFLSQKTITCFLLKTRFRVMILV